MAIKPKIEAQNPLILRSHRLMEAFTKSDDERDFYLDRQEGFIIYVNLDKPEDEINTLEKEIAANAERYCMIPKLTFYETKKIMEGFVNEKVYDIDTKEKLLDIIQSKEARENFLEFIYDHLSELEKWQQYYQERSRIRIIEWLRNNHFHFVFEEDLDLAKLLIEKLKKELFIAKAGKDVLAARKLLVTKAKTYYSNEALNPRPKRGRPPKQAIKQEIESHITTDIYTTVPPALLGFLFTPDISNASSITFSTKFESEEQIIANRKLHALDPVGESETLTQKLALLRNLSTKWVEGDDEKETKKSSKYQDNFDAEEMEDDNQLNGFDTPSKKRSIPTSALKASKQAKSKEPLKKSKATLKPAKKVAPAKKAAVKKMPAKKASTAAPKKTKLRPVKKLIKKTDAGTNGMPKKK
jgi:hypothetical protein